jgi:hypothetical protein
MIKKLFLTLLLLVIFASRFALAHQPRIVESHQTIVVDPEVSKAYYGQLTGVPDVYTIHADTSFKLYVNVLVPDITGQKKDVSAIITQDGKPLAELNGMTFDWKQMFEPFGYDRYWTGPEYKLNADPGTYVVTVTSVNNDSKYSLAIGERENFDFKEIMNALTLVPQLKRSFFNESPISFMLSPFGWGLIVILYLLAGIVGLLYRFILQRVTRNSVRGLSQNIGTGDRIIRFAIGVLLLLWAITTSWSPILIFFSGFALFEGIFSWCGFYAALGKNTCPVG